MKIGVFYKQFLGEGGFPREWRRIVFELAKHGASIHVYCISDFSQEHIHDNVSIFQYKGVRRSSFKIPHLLEKQLLKDIPDLDIFEIVACYEPENISVMKLLYENNVPYVIAPLGHLAPNIIKNNFIKKTTFINIFLKKYMQKAAGIHVVSVMEKVWVSKYTAKPTITARLGSFVSDVVQYKDRRYYTESLKISNNSKIILYLGRLDIFGKGLCELLDGFMLAAKKDDNLCLVIIGPDEKNNKNKLINKIKEQSIPNVYILDPIYGGVKYYALASADIFIYPSRYDILPRAIREALSVGTPVIASKETHFGDLIEKYNAGLICNVDAKDISKSISIFFNKQNCTSRMRVGALNLTKHGLSWSDEAYKLLVGLASVAQNKKIISEIKNVRL